jgi:hypothetical protein
MRKIVHMQGGQCGNQIGDLTDTDTQIFSSKESMYIITKQQVIDMCHELFLWIWNLELR